MAKREPLYPHVPRCRHNYVIIGTPEVGVYGFCNRCGMRTPLYPWYSGAWAKDLFSRAEGEGSLFVDKSLIDHIKH